MMEMPTTAFLPDERVLVRELTHRIGNEFTCAANMISLAAARATNTEARAALTTVMEQIEGFARVHRAMRMPDLEFRLDAVAYLRELCHSMSRSRLERRNIDLIFVERPLSLHAEQCWLLGMILYELISNASRHAFDGRGGEIKVETVQARGHVECRVSDDGAAPMLARRGSGLRIVEELAASLGGAFDRRSGPRGSACIVIFPIE
jgi:two-component sensor histidine kinase